MRIGQKMANVQLFAEKAAVRRSLFDPSKLSPK